MFKRQKLLILVLLTVSATLYLIKRFGVLYDVDLLFDYKLVYTKTIIDFEPLNKLLLNSPCSCRPEEIRLASTDKYHYINSNLKLDRKFFELQNVTCDLFNVLRRGPNQKVIGLSLYGNDQFYYKELKFILKLISKYYPEWIVRVYYDKTVDSELKCEIECMKNNDTGDFYDHVDFCSVSKIPNGLIDGNIWNGEFIHAMKWRWFPIGDPFVDIFMSRDTDSWITQREYDAVDVWLKTNTLFHVMRDHPYHSVPILGGMWGFKNANNRQLGNSLFSLITNKNIAKIYNGDGKHHKQGDQDFLAQHVWQIAKLNATVHASFYCDSFGSKTEPFPTQRSKYFCYVSCLYCCEEIYTKQNFTWKCPEKCRPNDHKDWLYC